MIIFERLSLIVSKFGKAPKIYEIFNNRHHSTTATPKGINLHIFHLNIQSHIY